MSSLRDLTNMYIKDKEAVYEKEKGRRREGLEKVLETNYRNDP